MDDVAQGIFKFYRLSEEHVPLLESNAKATSAFTDARKDEVTVGICRSIAMSPPFQVYHLATTPSRDHPPQRPVAFWSTRFVYHANLLCFL